MLDSETDRAREASVDERGHEKNERESETEKERERGGGAVVAILPIPSHTMSAFITQQSNTLCGFRVCFVCRKCHMLPLAFC